MGKRAGIKLNAKFVARCLGVDLINMTIYLVIIMLINKKRNEIGDFQFSLS